MATVTKEKKFQMLSKEELEEIIKQIWKTGWNFSYKTLARL